MNKQQIVQSLKQSVLFFNVSSTELEKYAEVCRIQVISEGEYVYRQGDESSVFFVIALGEAELILEREGGGSNVVGRITQGGHFGETGLLIGKPRSVSARALCDLVLICFDKRVFRSVLLTNNFIHKQLDAALAERLRVAWLDQADTASSHDASAGDSQADDVILFKDRTISQIKLRRLEKKRGAIFESRSAQLTEAAIGEFAANSDPYLLTGESGTGKTIIARQIHNQSSRSEGLYEEIDLREYEPMLLEKRLFGTERSNYPFAKARQAGIFERCSGGTVVFSHIRLMKPELQAKIVRVIESSTFAHIDSDRPVAMHARIVFVSLYPFDVLEHSGKIIPELMAILRKQHFHVPALREHKRDLPRLIEHYLRRFSKEYGKNINKVPPETMGLLMNYDWPGNLTELSSVIRRAVMLAHKDEILSDHILLGLPKTEGKWEYNILRLPFVKNLLQSKAFPAVPRLVVGVFVVITVLALFFGPKEAERNLGLTLSWAIGWPLLFFSFFFLARTWCSVCSLAMPGTLLQHIIQPKRRAPQLVKDYSGWIMAVLCIVVLWIEIVWNAYDNPILTGWIILAITIGSSVCSVIFTRRAWCRYLCPLGAVNAIFAMPSVIELRANRHVCLNRCENHLCFGGGAVQGGCPMFRHPYLVDNNRDCINCAACIKSCANSSIHLNVRLAPQELWDLQTPRRADSFLIVSLGAIFFPFALQSRFGESADLLVHFLGDLGLSLPLWLSRSLIFFTAILLCQIAYYLMVRVQAWYAGMDRTFLLSLLGYGFIPMILGGYLAVHFEIFISDAWRVVPIIQEFLHLPVSVGDTRLISRDSTHVLQIFSVLGGMLASMYATYRIICRVMDGDRIEGRTLMIPFSFLATGAALFLFMI